MYYLISILLFGSLRVFAQSPSLGEAIFSETDFQIVVETNRQNDERGGSFYFESIVYNEYLTSDQQKAFAEKNVNDLGRILNNAYLSKDMNLFEGIADTIAFHKPIQDWAGSIANYLVTNGYQTYKEHLVTFGFIDLSKMPDEILEHLAEKIWLKGSKEARLYYGEYLYNHGFGDKYDTSGFQKGPPVRGNASEASASLIYNGCVAENLTLNSSNTLIYEVGNQLRYFIKNVKRGSNVTNTFVRGDSEKGCSFEISFEVYIDGTLKLPSVEGVVYSFSPEESNSLTSDEIVSLLFSLREDSKGKKN